MIVHTWADATPDMTLCGQVIRPGVYSTYNPLGVTCLSCIAAASVTPVDGRQEDVKESHPPR